MIRRSRRRRRRGVLTSPTAARFKSYDHRTHPAKRLKPPPGTCTWCLKPITDLMGRPDKRHTFCSRSCVDVYLLHTDPKLMRRHVFDRDLGCCAVCGRRHVWGGDFEIDHELPLFLANDDWFYWSAENQRVACASPCHKNKTASDRNLMKPARLARTKARRKSLMS